MKVYMSGIEGNEDNIMKLLDAGYPIKYLMASYLSLRKRQDSIEKIIKLRKQYGVHLILDSGAHAVVYEENAKKEKGKDSWHAINKDVAAIKDDPDTYVDSYIEFLEKNREMYDIAVEFDIQGTVGDEKVNEWREKFLSKGLPILFVMHLKTGDVQEFVDKWHEKGLQYIGFGGANGMEDKVKAITKHAQDLGMWVHWFGYTPLDLFRRSNADSVDSTSWLAAPKLAEVYTHRGKQLTSWNIKDNPIKFKAILKDDVFKVFDQKDFERRLSEKKYYYISYYSLKEFALWNEENSKTANVKKYETQLELSKTGEIQLPTWAQDFDKMGRPKAIYLNARYNATKHAVTAKGLHQNALVCHNCAINDRCPVASTDPNNDLCFFLPFWKSLGEKTRNREQLRKTLEEIVANDIVRLNYQQYQEAQLGQGIDKSTLSLQNLILKELELLARFNGGSSNIIMNVDKQQINFGNIDEELNSVRQEYGEEFASKIKKKLESEDGSNEY